MKVTITGATATGKTTVALLIADALRAAGFSVNETDPDVLEGSAHPELQEARLPAVIARGTVTVETVQLQRRAQYNVSVKNSDGSSHVMPLYAGDADEARSTAEQLLGSTGVVTDVSRSS